MKKIFKKSIIFFVLLESYFITSCNNSLVLETADKMPISEKTVSEQVTIGDEIIYGEEFSLNDIYDELIEEIEESARAINIARNLESEDEEYFEFEDSDFIDMVYFSVHPTTIDSIKLINDTMGYLNPTELDKEILQACDAEQLIFINTDVSDIENIEKSINFNTNYYYIVTKEVANEISVELENFYMIEEFEMMTPEALNKIAELLTDYDEGFEEISFDESRGAFSKLWKGIKKAAKTVGNALSTAADNISKFLTKTYKISGKVSYKYEGIDYPAYGIQIRAVADSSCKVQTTEEGNFNLGSFRDADGLLTIWLDYNNSACSISNFLGVTASTLVKTGLSSQLQDLTIKGNSDYANAKMAICRDLLVRYNDESKRHSPIPQAVIWTTELGKGTSSSPAFYARGNVDYPDIVLTGVTSQDEEYKRIQIVHHEYTHFLHYVYVSNSSKSNFWSEVVKSEIGSTLSDKSENPELLIKIINGFLNTNTKTGFYYDFNNPYVYFAENYAEWYSFVGCYGKGSVGKTIKPENGNGKIYQANDLRFFNTEVFTKIIIMFENYGIKNPTDEIVTIIDKYDVTTYNEFYSALIKEYPMLKNKINTAFKSYKQYGNSQGNVIIYQ